MARQSEGLQIRGVVGQIMWSYYVAAALHGYTVQHDRETGQWRLRGTVVTSDMFKLRQRPLEFVAPHEKGAWRWIIESHDIQQGTIRAILSPSKESRR